jgi:MFS superfamily sulfate permease-like transporter
VLRLNSLFASFSDKRTLFADASAGFYVFLLALPLSLGIAEASGFPAVMGLITAAVGGVVTSWFTGSELSIKGPAAGLIVIVLGAVTELGSQDPSQGWIWALMAIFVSGMVQVVFGLAKLGKYVNVIPLPAIQGMLAAIGVVILSKQLYIMLGIPAVDSSGKVLVKPLDLLWNLTKNLKHTQWSVFIVGIWSFSLVGAWSLFKTTWLKSIPSPLVVMLTAIPLSLYLGLPDYYKLGFDIQLDALFQWRLVFKSPVSWWLFLKYVSLFAIIGSLESLLTVNAIHSLKPDAGVPQKDKDLVAVGLGNMLSSVLGGLPMISEVARSTANIQNGAQSRRSNFFHGIFILLFLLFSSYFNRWIPLSTLAAMLVLVGIRLANPRVLIDLHREGWSHIGAFLATLLGSLALDLLWGLVLGTAVKMIIEKSTSRKPS